MTPEDFYRKLREARQLLQEHKFALALPRFEKLVRQSPRDAVIWMEYGNAASGLREFDLAEWAWRKAMEMQPDRGDLVALIGRQYEVLRQPEKAEACFVRAAAANPRDINPRVSLAVLLEKSHRLEEARAALGECLAIDPKDEQSRYLSAVLDRRERKLDQAESRLRDLIASRPTHHFVHYACRYELAHVLDTSGRYDEAMRWLNEAKDLVRALTDTQQYAKFYDLESDKARRLVCGLPRNILKEWSKSFPEKKREPAPPLAFLGGHPRSGTTLLEQVLGAHPGVAGLDEPTAFPEILQPQFFNLGELSAPRLNVLRRQYVRALQRELGGAAGGKLLLDKNPSPTARLPLWLRVFPELKVVIALRDPRDVVLSCYFQNLQINSVSVNFLSLERLAKHYTDLMNIWLATREWEGFSWLETRYEDLVMDLPKEGGRVAAFLGLGWDPAQIRFHEASAKKHLYSPTYQDVTRPVYSRSMGRWRAYERHLAPILPLLEPYCRLFGYETASAGAGSPRQAVAA